MAVVHWLKPFCTVPLPLVERNIIWTRKAHAFKTILYRHIERLNCNTFHYRKIRKS
jgi:hypothetical protein